MLLGQGSRKVGETCWSHAQCLRDQANTHCHALVCVCDGGFQNLNGRCSRSIWDNLGSGLIPWELIVFSIMFAIGAFAIFTGCVYFVISKLFRCAKTGPCEARLPKTSFQEGADKKDNCGKDGTKPPKIYETKLLNDSKVESQLVDENGISFRGGNTGYNNNGDSISNASTVAFETPTPRFITPLDYKANNSRMAWQSSRWSSSSQRSTGTSTSQSRSLSLRQHLFVRAWSATASVDEEADDWYQPNRNHIRRVEPNSPAGTTRLPLLLRSSTFSESEESP